MRRARWLAAIPVSALMLVSCGGPTASSPTPTASPTPSPTINPATLAQLELKPLRFPVVKAGGTCPSTPMSTVDYGYGPVTAYGSGPVYGIGGPLTTDTWGDYFDVMYVTNPQLTGVFLVRIRDLKSSRVGVFVGPNSAGIVVGTDTIGGTVTQQHAELAFDASHHPPTSGTSGWGIWSVRQGVAAGWSHCFGIQIDGASFTQVVTGNG